MLTTDEFHVYEDPLPRDLPVSLAARHLQYPAGLPAGTTLGEVGYGPSIILLDYDLPGAWRRPNHLLRFWLVDPRALTAPRSPRAFSFKMGGWLPQDPFDGTSATSCHRDAQLSDPFGDRNIKRAMLAEAKRRSAPSRQRWRFFRCSHSLHAMSSQQILLNAVDEHSVGNSISVFRLLELIALDGSYVPPLA